MNFNYRFGRSINRFYLLIINWLFRDNAANNAPYENNEPTIAYRDNRIHEDVLQHVSNII